MGRTYSAPAARKAICLLELMATEDKPFSVTELATRLDVTVNSVFRILKELETLQYIVKNESDSTYTLTAKLYYLGISLSSRISLKHSAQPFLTRLREETRETVLLTTFGQHYATLIVDQQISSEPIKFISTAGLEYASYSSAMGKAMLACLSTQELEDYLFWVNFAKVTEYTISSPDELRRELVQVRTQGYAVDMQESVLGLKCVAAPIFSIGGRLEGALGVSALAFRLPDVKLPSVARTVCEQARLLSASLGYNG